MMRNSTLARMLVVLVACSLTGGTLMAAPIVLPLRTISVVDVPSEFLPVGGDHGLGVFTAAGDTDIVIGHAGGQFTFEGGSFEITTSLFADSSAGGFASGEFTGGGLIFSDSADVTLLSGTLIALMLHEVGDDIGMLAGIGAFEVTGGTLDADFGEDFGEVYQMSFQITPPALDDFSLGFTGFTDITVSPTGDPIPEPATLSLLAFSALAMLRRRRR